MIAQIWEVKRVACYARAETFTKAVASVASIIEATEATALNGSYTRIIVGGLVAKAQGSEIVRN